MILFWPGDVAGAQFWAGDKPCRFALTTQPTQPVGPYHVNRLKDSAEVLEKYDISVVVIYNFMDHHVSIAEYVWTNDFWLMVC